MPSFIIVRYVRQILERGGQKDPPNPWAAPKKPILNRVKKHPSTCVIQVEYLFQDNVVRGKELLKLYSEYSRTSLYRMLSNQYTQHKLLVNANLIGRLKKVSLREEIIILQEMRKLREVFESFAIKRLQLVSGLGN